MYVESFSVKNIRCFRVVDDIALQHPDRPPSNGSVVRLGNVNLLLGNNGTGKTTLLKGIALSLIAPIAQSAGLRPYNLVRRIYRRGKGRRPENGHIDARVLLTAQDLQKGPRRKPSRAHLSIQLYRKGDNDYIGTATSRAPKWKAMDYDDSPAFLVLGYGATRRIAPSKENITSRAKESHLRYQRVRGLFEEDFSLVPMSFWLPNYVNAGRRKQVISILDRLLGGEYRFQGKLENGEYIFERDGAYVPLLALSDGFRAFIGWVSDMLYHVSRGIPAGRKLFEAEGVVMVDEIDLHLHPKWQRTIISTLSETFPKIQFIFTSHSPLVTGSLEWRNIWVMKEGGPVQLPDEPIYGLSADQVLQSPYFNLDSTRPPEVAAELLDLDQKAQKGDRKAAVEFMRRLSHGSEKRVFRRLGGPARLTLQPKGKRTRRRASSPRRK
jgi:energy-coupling factor transporter ATP-binding protein EcfA2